MFIPSFLIFTTLSANSADGKVTTVLLFLSQKIRLDSSCKLSPKETICKKCQSKEVN